MWCGGRVGWWETDEGLVGDGPLDDVEKCLARVAEHYADDRPETNPRRTASPASLQSYASVWTSCRPLGGAA